MSYTYKYPRSAVTADVVAITKEEVPKVLLIQRGYDPYKGCWAFPGGFMEMDETTKECAIRELEGETTWWYKINYESITGYVYGKFAKKSTMINP